jgi:sugar-specific transcriptional regulator TrmB
MDVVELLQHTGLTKYEAEAYYTLLREGALTGYELGKRSPVPLSRSYEVLERLSQKGLVLVQPGEPPHYLAEQPDRVLNQMRQTVTDRLDHLSDLLSALPPRHRGDGFWVLQGRDNVLARARAMIEEAHDTLCLATVMPLETEVEDLVALARARELRLLVGRTTGTESSRMLLVSADRREALVGTIAPADGCQAVVSTNPALVELVHTSIAGLRPAGQVAHAPEAAETGQEPAGQWLAWETEKQRRLLHRRPEVA